MRLAIIGAGPGGYVAAIKAAQLGAKVTVIEKDEVGGVCLNWGCIPTKSLVASADALAKTRRSADFGIKIKGEPLPDFSRIIERKNKIVDIQVKGIRTLLKQWGVNLMSGHGILTSPREITVISGDGSRDRIETDKIIIATGSRPIEIPELPFDGRRILSSKDALALKKIPKSLLIIGGGIIGCEFACIFREFGSEVTIIERLSRAVPSEDFEISGLLEREFRKKKIKLLTNITVKKAAITDEAVRVILADGKEITADKVLVSAGRLSNIEGIGLDAVGVKTGSSGDITVNGKMETNIRGVYGIGDVVGNPMLAHVASREGIVAAQNCTGGNAKMDHDSVPVAIFTSPEIASVGLREHQAAEKEIKVNTGHVPFRTLAKSHVIGEIEGFIKIISDKRSDRILGVHIIGPHASDLIHEAALAIRKGLSTRDIAGTIHVHPTLAEVLMEAAEDVHDEGIHTPKK